MSVILHGHVYELFNKEYRADIYDGKTISDYTFKYQVNAINFLIKNGFKISAMHGKGLGQELWFIKEGN